MAHQEHTAPSGRTRDDGGGPMDEQRTVLDGMLKSVTIRNFRVFEELSIDHLSRINLIAGRNNAGKTSLLEALFLLAGGGNPQIAFNSNVTRGSELSVSGPTSSLQETYWKPMFFSLDTDKTITIGGEHAERGALTLRISLERPNVVEVPISGTEDVSGKSPPRRPRAATGVRRRHTARSREPGTRCRAEYRIQAINRSGSAWRHILVDSD